MSPDRKRAVRSTAERIFELKKPEEKDSDFARRIGLTPKTLNTYRRGVSGPSIRALATIARTTGVDAHWLVTGEGPRYRSEAQRAAEAGADPRILGALEKARGVVADLERAAGVETHHDPSASDAGEGEAGNRGPVDRSSSSHNEKNTQP